MPKRRYEARQMYRASSRTWGYGYSQITLTPVQIVLARGGLVSGWERGIMVRALTTLTLLEVAHLGVT